MIKRLFNLNLTEEKFKNEILNKTMSEKRIKEYLEKNININPLDEDKNPIIFKLIQKKHKEHIHLLLKNKVNLIIKNKHNKTILEEAVDREEKEIVKIILDYGYDINHKNHFGKTILHDISLFNEKLYFLIRHYKPNYAIKDIKGNIPIYYAIQNNNYNIMKYMLDDMKDEELNIKNNENENILFKAIEKEDNSYIKELLTRKININELDNNEENILFKIIEQGDKNLEIIELLIKKRIKINQININNEYVIEKIFRIEKENPNILFEKTKELLLKEGNFYLNKINKNNETILEHEINEKNYENVELLLNFEADINNKDQDGNTIIYKEIIKGYQNYRMIELLLKNGVNINYINKEGKDIVEEIVEIIGISKGFLKEKKEIHKKIRRNEKYELILKKISGYKQKVYIRGDGKNVIFDLVKYNDFETLKHILNFFPEDINKKDNEEKTPLMYMIEEGLLKKEKIDKDLFLERLTNILKYTVNIDEQDKEGRTVLHKAVIANDFEVVEKLVSKKNDINKIDLQGRTALQHTQWTGNYKIARLLILAGANINVKDNTGFSFFNYSAILGHDKLVILLIKAGVLMYNKSPKNKKALEYFKAKENDLEKLLETKHADDEKMKNALKEVVENLKQELKNQI